MGTDRPEASDDGQEQMKREAQHWLVRLSSGQATAADADALKAWCGQSSLHAKAFAEANLLWEALGPAAGNVDQAPPPAANSNIAFGRRAFLGGAIAASAAGAFYLAWRPPLELWPSASEFAADYRTAAGQRRQITGENGVSIDLNTKTSLNVRRGDQGQSFDLVSGEAAVATAQKLAAPISITAAGGEVRTSDARFNLRCEGSGAVVTCERGSVDIAYAGTVTTLQSGRRVSYGDGVIAAASTADPAVTMAWREGKLVFRGTPLSEVVDEINRYRSGRIVLMNEALGRRPVDASIPIDRVGDLIDLIRQAYGARLRELPGGVSILS
jgi:transmembrane sensor